MGGWVKNENMICKFNLKRFDKMRADFNIVAKIGQIW